MSRTGPLFFPRVPVRAKRGDMYLGYVSPFFPYRDQTTGSPGDMYLRGSGYSPEERVPFLDADESKPTGHAAGKRSSLRPRLRRSICKRGDTYRFSRSGTCPRTIPVRPRQPKISAFSRNTFNPMTTAATPQSRTFRAVPLAYFPMTSRDEVSLTWVMIVIGNCMLRSI